MIPGWEGLSEGFNSGKPVKYCYCSQATADTTLQAMHRYVLNSYDIEIVIDESIPFGEVVLRTDAQLSR
jgi:hypothetical protein